MNYLKHYNCLVENAQNRECTNGYVEKHHIVPRSMGGTNDKTNIVKLTAREHFIAHLLLWKHYNNTQMARAFALMCTNKTGERHKKSRFYESGKSAALGKGLTEEHRKNISESLRGKVKTEQHCKNLSEANKGKKLSEETRFKMSKARQGKVFTEEHKNKLSESLKNNLPKSVTEKLTCVHCGISTTFINIKRWHSENCKKKK